MMQTLRCWKCGTELKDLLLPLPRAAECRACHADQHVCRACLYYDVAVARSCREPIADDVQDKARANFCGYFQWRADAYQATDNEVLSRSRRQLDALFGEVSEGNGKSAPEDGNARSALDDLFK